MEKPPSTMKSTPIIVITILISMVDIRIGNAASIQVITENSTITTVSGIDRSGGEATRFVEEVLKNAGIPYQLQYQPWRRAYNSALADTNVLVFPLARSPGREKMFHWVGELIPVNYYLVKLKSRTDISVCDLNSAKRYRVGVVNFHVHHELLLEKEFSDLQTVNRNLQNLKKALLDRIDLFPISDVALLQLCKRHSIDCTQFEPTLKLEEISGGLYLAFSRGTDADLIEETVESFGELVASGRHETIFQDRFDNIKEFGSRWPYEFVQEPETPLD
jgi:polar amino acid transport system substrate-binding protein